MTTKFCSDADIQSLGSLLAESRERSGLTLERASFYVGTVPSQLRKLEDGHARFLPGPRLLHALASLYQVDVAQLVAAAGYELDKVAA